MLAPEEPARELPYRALMVILAPMINAILSLGAIPPPTPVLDALMVTNVRRMIVAATVFVEELP
jgi:hypothetical protein